MSRRRSQASHSASASAAELGEVPVGFEQESRGRGRTGWPWPGARVQPLHGNLQEVAAARGEQVPDGRVGAVRGLKRVVEGVN